MGHMYNFFAFIKYRKYAQFIIRVERGDIKVREDSWLERELSQGQPKWSAFCSYYNQWLRTQCVTLPKHQWTQYYTKRDNNNKH